MTYRPIRNALIALLPLLFVGCVSGYKSFYTPATGVSPEIIAARRVSPPPAIPIVERFAPAAPDTILAAYAKRGYVMIGSSMFNSGRNEPETSALKQGQDVGADLVLVLNPKYTGSITSVVPITVPSTTTSNTSGSATAYGSGGSVTAYGNATTTTYGTNTTYIPMTVNRSDYGAVYFVKQRFSFGAFLRDLNDTERQELQTNQGVVVLNIADDSPAFKADILPGDVVAAIDGITVPNKAGLAQIMDDLKGKQVTVAIVRRGLRIDKSVKLNN
jgi:membrane-associated protease RseP (regulator of RpoE activity)